MTGHSRPRTALAPGAEFDRIRAILGDDWAMDRGKGGLMSVGPGDDAAVLGEWVLSTDLSVEEVHFRRSWISLRSLGYRAVTVALSDIGAMGAEPVAVLVSMALPEADLAVARALGEGLRQGASAAGAFLAGGDLSRSPGPIAIDVVAVGRTDDPVLRSTAAPGDDLWVTGTLGGAAGAVALWESGEGPDEALRARFERPSPPLHLLRELRRAGHVSAGIDVSDGLLADAGHLAAASDVGVRIHEARVPINPHLGEFDSDRRLDLALTGGEDYEVLFTAPATARQALEAWGAGVVALRRVGEVVKGAGVVRVAPDGSEGPGDGGGFDHFRDDAP